MLQVYTGTGKGKTTAALGVAVRGAGHGLKTLMLCFLKDDPEYGEARAASFVPGFELRQVGRDAFVNFRNPEQIDLDLCRTGWDVAKEAIAAKQVDIVILDELNIVWRQKCCPWTRLSTSLRLISMSWRLLPPVAARRRSSLRLRI